MRKHTVVVHKRRGARKWKFGVMVIDPELQKDVDCVATLADAIRLAARGIEPEGRIIIRGKAVQELVKVLSNTG